MPHSLRASRGVSLIELMVTIAVVAILSTIAIPSFSDMLDRHRVTGAAETIHADLLYARSLALERGQPVSVAFTGSGTNWCYGITVGNAGCDCTTANSCAVDGVEKVFRSADASRVGLVAAPAFGANTYTVFDPLRGEATGGTVQLASEKGKKVNVVLSLMGRVRLCTPDGTVGAYKGCS